MKSKIIEKFLSLRHIWMRWDVIVTCWGNTRPTGLYLCAYFWAKLLKTKQLYKQTNRKTKSLVSVTVWLTTVTEWASMWLITINLKQSRNAVWRHFLLAWQLLQTYNRFGNRSCRKLTTINLSFSLTRKRYLKVK